MTSKSHRFFDAPNSKEHAWSATLETAPKGTVLAATLSLAWFVLSTAGGCDQQGDQDWYGQSGEALRVCADGETLDGIDVSHHQDVVDWDEVAADGIQFAFIRVSDGLYVMDRQFDRNWAEAKRVGIIRGAYQFFRPNQDAAAQADLLVERLGGALEQGDLPPVIDVEVTGGRSRSEVVRAVQTWLDRVEDALGVRPMVYTSPGLWDDVAASSAFGDYLLWVAHYGTSCPRMPMGWDAWAFHQYTDSGHVSGIGGDTDRDRFNGSYQDLLAITVGGQGQAEPVCGDGVCQPNENCAEDCCAVIPEQGRVVDDQEACFEAGGDSRWWRDEDAGWEGHLLWTHTTATRVYNYGVWHLTIAEAGRYRVEAYTAAPYAESRQARYQVHHAGMTDAVIVDQTSVDGWNLVGEFDFLAGGDQWIRLEDFTGEPNSTATQIVFDAIRLTRVTSQPTEPTEGNADIHPQDTDLSAGGGGAGYAQDPGSQQDEEAMGPSDRPSIYGGCATAGGQTPLPVLFLLGLWWVLVSRRRN